MLDMGNYEELLLKCTTEHTTWSVIKYSHPDDNFIEVSASQNNVQQQDFEEIVKSIIASGCKRVLFNGRYLNSNQMLELAAALSQTVVIACFILTHDIRKVFRSVGIPVELAFDNYEHGYPASISFLTSHPFEQQSDNELLEGDEKLKKPKREDLSEPQITSPINPNELQDEFDY